MLQYALPINIHILENKNSNISNLKDKVLLTGFERWTLSDKVYVDISPCQNIEINIISEYSTFEPREGRLV